MASHLLLVCVVFGYAGGEENDKKREQRNFRQADFMPVGSLIHRLLQNYAFNRITNRLPLPNSLSTVSVPP